MGIRNARDLFTAGLNLDAFAPLLFPHGANAKALGLLGLLMPDAQSMARVAQPPSPESLTTFGRFRMPEGLFGSPVTEAPLPRNVHRGGYRPPPTFGSQGPSPANRPLDPRLKTVLKIGQFLGVGRFAPALYGLAAWADPDVSYTPEGEWLRLYREGLLPNRIAGGTLGSWAAMRSIL